MPPLFPTPSPNLLYSPCRQEWLPLFPVLSEAFPAAGRGVGPPPAWAGSHRPDVSHSFPPLPGPRLLSATFPPCGGLCIGRGWLCGGVPAWFYIFPVWAAGPLSESTFLGSEGEGRVANASGSLLSWLLVPGRQGLGGIQAGRGSSGLLPDGLGLIPKG